MRSKSDKKKPLVPSLRFPEFREAGAWEVQTIDQLASKIAQGGTPKTSIPKYWNGDIPWITPAEMGEDAAHHYAETTHRTISREGFENSSTELLPVNSVIISSRAPIGYVTINKIEMATNQGCKGIVPKKNTYHEFFYFSLIVAKQRLNDLGAGAGFKEISTSTLKAFQISIPKHIEQQKIAHCLSSLDEVIGLQAKKVQALKQHKKGLMQQLFPAEGETTPRLRFPDFREAGAWEFIPLEAIAPLVNDRVQLKDISNVNYVSTENILQDFGGVAVANKLPTVNSVSSFQAGDVLLANIRPYLKKVWAANFSGGASNDVLVFRPRNSQGGQYVAHILKNNRFINYVMAGAKGVKMPRGDINSIKEYPVPIPPETTEQQKIAHCLSSL
ncbi:restriction endonuclease subunit S, partial [Thiolapillus sp.]|uniref:restriction endonuclease subunit S n=1 Tax=Thiolapillus sp. TaxID=2017437 RepID=UPI003AF59D94